MESHGASGEVGNESAASEVMKSSSAREQQRALTQKLMEQIVAPSNLNQAFKRVKSNKGAPGIDGMTVEQLPKWISAHKESLIASLLNGTYQPKAVRKVSIPKPQGGARELGIPTVIDRLIQQAILQVLQPIYEPMFSENSYGFRPGRSAHDAVSQASRYVSEGKSFVVDIDLEKFFDRVNHDILMSRLARSIGDSRLLRLIRRYLNAGMMFEGVVCRREEGTPQGGPLSPLLSNILLDDLDRELETRGHSFCRYADDCNIYVRSERAAKRVLASVTLWLSAELKLSVNQNKSAASRVGERKFLGHRIYPSGHIGLAPESLIRFKTKIREATKRRTPRPIERVITELTPLLRGWLNYYRLCKMKNLTEDLDCWIRRRLRTIRLHQCKRAFGTKQFLVREGVATRQAWYVALSGKNTWRLAHTPQAHQAMNTKWFEERGLHSLHKHFRSLTLSGTA